MTTDTANADLHWDVLTIKRPGLSRDLPPGKEELMWVANSSTLIYGERDAVLVDTFLTTEQSQALLDWVVASGKNLTAIYVTHGHGDHFFGLASLLRSQPPKSLRPCMSIYRPPRSRTSGVGFSPARFQTACWSPSHSKTMS
jgi:glyoxylase-like metal-dependent hydrolase (beta-lactamase superfamily II)